MLSRARPSNVAHRLFGLLFLFVGGILLGYTLLTQAQGTTKQRRGGASVFVTQATMPRTLNERALLGFARGHQARIMEESNEADLATRHWNGSLVVNFNAPPGDLEFHGIFYDITDGAQTFVDDMTIFVSDRNQRTYLQRLNLQRPRFRPNRRMELVITVRRAEVGRVRFDLRGEEPRRNGQVDFTEATR